MKTIVIVHHTGIWGGGTKSLIDLCEMLGDNYNVIVCVPKGFPDFAGKISQYGCTVYEFSTHIPMINIYSGRPPLFSVVTLRSILSLWNIKKIGDEILILKPDVVIFNTLVTAVTARYLSGHVKIICIDRETLTNRLEIFLYRKILDKHLNAIAFLSEYERRKLNFRKAVSFVFPDCVKLDALSNKDKSHLREKAGIDTDKYGILFMGGLAKMKGTDVILEAMDSLDERFVLIFAGDMNESKLSKAQLWHDIKYPAYYRFKKRVIQYYYKRKGTPSIFEVGLCDSMDELILMSDIVVFPSTSVHQPRPCIEAGAYKKPVVISDYEQTKEYFKDKYNALTFTPQDAADLAQKLLYAIDHREEMRQMGNNNRIMTETKHDFYLCKERICSFIEKVCDNEDKD